MTDNLSELIAKVPSPEKITEDWGKGMGDEHFA